MRALGIIGASGHGRVIADIATRNGYDPIVFFDDDPQRKSNGRYPVVGASGDALGFDGEVFVAIGDRQVRERLMTMLEASGARLAVLIHPMAAVAENVTIGAGSVVMAGAVVNPGSVIGKGCIVNSNAVVEHDCLVGDYVHIAPGAILAGTVRVGARTWVGVSAAVRNNVTIAANCMIGMGAVVTVGDNAVIAAGAVVTKDIVEAGTYISVPARRKEEEMPMAHKQTGGVPS